MKPEDEIRHLVGRDLIDLPELARTLGRYKWGILGVMLLVMAATLLYAYSLRAVYRGTVVILIEPRNQRIVQGQDVYDPGTGTTEYYSTQAQILKSREIAERIVSRLGLTENVAFNAPQRQSLFEKLNFRRFMPFLEPESLPASAEDAESLKRESITQAVMDSITVEPLYYTQLVKLSFDAYSPELSAQVANAAADIYIESGLQAKLDATRKATKWLTEKISDIKVQLEKSEAALQAFKEKAQIVTVGSARNLSESEMVDYSQRLREAQKKKTELASAYEKVRQTGTDPKRLREVNAVMLNPQVQRASDNMTAAQEAIKQTQERYGAKHPQMATARARLETAIAAFDEQLRVAAEALRTEYEIAQQNERVLMQQVAVAREKIQKLDREDYQLSVLQREVTTNRELYDNFLTRFKQTDAGGSFESLNARVIDPAVVPRVSYEPRIKRMLVIAGALGLFLGLSLTLLWHLLSEEIHSAEDLESLTQLPVLSVLPIVRGILGSKVSPAQTYLDAAQSSFAEGIRSARAALQISDVDRRFKVIMVTSSVPKEGKSNVSASMAFALGASERVLLVDADLRMPTLHKLLSLATGSKGLSDALAGNLALEQCIHKHDASGIWVLPAGTSCLNPSELLASEAFANLLNQLRVQFDRIVLDTPPCLAASDALILSKHADTTLFVVKSDSTPRRAIKNAIKALNYARAPLLGHIINQVNVHSNNEYLSGYYYAYNTYGPK